jgi:hypothetical protein
MATVITAARATTETTTRIGERRGGGTRERDLGLGINGGAILYIESNNGWPIYGPNYVSNGGVTSTVISQVTSKKKRTRVVSMHLSMRVDS